MASWTTPKTWVAGAQLTAAEMNTHVRDNETWLKDALTTTGITSDSAISQLEGALIGVRAVRTSTQSISDATTTAVQLNATDDWDSDSYHDTVTNNTRITIPAGLGGYYLIGWGIDFAGNATGRRRGDLQLNGSGTPIAGTEMTITAGGTSDLHLNAAAPYLLSAADYFELYVNQNSTGSLNLQDAVVWAVRLFAS